MVVHVDPSLKLCDPGACCVWVCSPSAHRMEHEREREDEEDDSNEFIRNKEDIATQRNDRRGKHHMVESCEETPPTGTTFKQRAPRLGPLRVGGINTTTTSTSTTTSTNTPRRHDFIATPLRPDR